jgi:DNA polymerase, archaea type
MSQILYGSNEEERIVAVHPTTERAMRLYVRSENGIQTRDVEYFPFFHLSNPKYLDGFTKKHWIKKLEGENFFSHLCAFTGWLDMWDAIRHVLEQYNENVPLKVSSFFDLPVLHVITDSVGQFLAQTGRTLFKGMVFDELYRIQISIRTLRKHGSTASNPERAEDRIVVITLSDNRGWSQIIHGKRKTEKEMLLELCDVIIRKDPDIIEGHSFLSNDLSYLLARNAIHALDFKIGRDGSAPHAPDFRLISGDRSPSNIYTITGRHALDTSQLLRSSDASRRELDGYTLDDAARYFSFGRTECLPIPQDRINWYWENEPDTLIQSAVADTEDSGKLSQIIAPPIFNLTKMIPYNFGTASRLHQFGKLESFVFREYLRAKHSIPRPENIQPVPEGYSELFYSGILGPIIELSFENLYASIMQDENLYPRNDTLGCFASILDSLLHQRDDLKENDPANLHLDPLLDSVFDYFGSGRTLFNDRALAVTLAARCRDLLSRLASVMTEWNGKVIAIDEDRIFFIPPSTTTEQPAEHQFIETISRSLPSRFKIRIVQRYKKMLSFKKKSWVLLRNDGRLKIQGSGILSRSLEKCFRDFITHSIHAMLNDDIDKMHELYVLYHRNIELHKLTVREFARNEVLRDSIGDYSHAIEKGMRNRSASYETALRAGRSWKPGDRIAFYMTGEDPNAKEVEYSKLASEWDPNFPDDNTPYYLKRLDECTKRFETFFTEKDFHAVFSTEDLFGFTSKGIRVRTSIVKVESGLSQPEEKSELPIEPKIWLDDESDEV